RRRAEPDPDPCGPGGGRSERPSIQHGLGHGAPSVTRLRRRAATRRGGSRVAPPTTIRATTGTAPPVRPSITPPPFLMLLMSTTERSHSITDLGLSCQPLGAEPPAGS